MPGTTGPTVGSSDRGGRVMRRCHAAPAQAAPVARARDRRRASGKVRTALAALAAVALLAAGCGRSGGDASAASANGGAGSGSTPTQSSTQAVGDFGTLKNVCHGGSPSGSPDQGVSSSSIQLGVFSDVGYTKVTELPDAAKVFTSWCNAAGGIDGRKVVANVRDAALLQVQQQQVISCQKDFMMVGGSSGLDGEGTATRLKCLEPAFPNQAVMLQNRASSLQLDVSGLGSPKYSDYIGEYRWLLKEKYPDSRSSLGIINAQTPVTTPLSGQAVEGLQAMGGKVTYNDLYPPLGLSDWTPYATKIKQKKVKGLIFYGEYDQLAKLEQALTNIGYKLDWIDANSNSYGDNFPKLLGNAAGSQNNIVDLSGLYPPEKASSNPATQQVFDLFKKYAPGRTVTAPALRAFSAWLLFAESAETCGNDLTRKCVFDAGSKQPAWTGGGLQAPVNFTTPDAPPNCFNIEQLTSSGWQPADFHPNDGAYRCGQQVYKFTGTYPEPVTLASVGKSISELR